MNEKFGDKISHVSCTNEKFTYHDYFLRSFKYNLKYIKICKIFD